MKRLCTICARGGSKGVKNKNIRNMHGKPLIAYSIEQAKDCGLFNYIAVSSDSEEILEVAKHWGVDLLIKRPDELATDTAAKLPVIQHCVNMSEELSNEYFDTIVDLDVTSPLRSTNDILNAVYLLENSDASNVITGTPSHRSPYFNMVELDDDGYVYLSKQLPNLITRRQDVPKCYDMNASIYVWKRKTLMESVHLFQPKTVLYEMPQERSIDIDSELDWKIVEWIFGSRIEGEHNE